MKKSLNKGLSPILGLALTMGPYFAIASACEKYPTRHRPVVAWWLSIPIALALVLTLVTLYDVCYVTMWLLLKKGPVHIGNLLSTAYEYWKTDSITAIPFAALEQHFFLAAVLFATALCAYYGSLSKEAGEIVKAANEVVEGIREGE